MPTPATLWVWHTAQVENGRGWVGNHKGTGPCSGQTKKKSRTHNYGPLTSLSCVGFWDCHHRNSAMRNTDVEEREIEKSRMWPTKLLRVEERSIRGKMCPGFQEDRNLIETTKFNTSQWLIKSRQPCKMCLLSCASMCTWKESERTPKPVNTHIIDMKPLQKQADKFTLTQIAFGDPSKASPFPSFICTMILFSSALWASKLEVRLPLFSLQKHLSKQQQSQGQVWPVSVGDSSWQKFSRDNS